MLCIDRAFPPCALCDHDAATIRLVPAFGCSGQQPPAPPPLAGRHRRQPLLVLRHLAPQPTRSCPLFRPSYYSSVCDEPSDQPISTFERRESRSTTSSTCHLFLASLDSNPIPRSAPTAVPATAPAALRKPFAHKEIPEREICYNGRETPIRRRSLPKSRTTGFCARGHHIRNRLWSRDRTAASRNTDLLLRDDDFRVTFVVVRVCTVTH